MTFLRPTGSQWRTPEMGKAYIVSTSRGVMRAQIWPKKRGPAKTDDERDRQQVFNWFQGLAKRLYPWETEYEREAIQTHNRTHRGQRGSAAIRLRDWITQRLYGRGVMITTDVGLIFYPAAIARDASDILDHITATPGQVLQHAATEWGPIPAGQASHVLTRGAPGSANTWTDPLA